MSEAWMAERTLRDGAGNVWTVAVGAPRRSANPHVWECPRRITRAGTERVELVCGIDAMQALELAISSIGVELEREDSTQLRMFVTQDGVAKDATAPGDTGFYRQIPSAVTFEFYQRMCRLIDDELAKNLEEMMRRRAAQAKREPR